MATEEEKNILNDSSAEPQVTDSVVLAAQENLSAHDVFVGDEDFYRLLEESAGDVVAKPTIDPYEPEMSVAKNGRFSSAQKALVICIVLVAATLLYLLQKYHLKPIEDPSSTNVENSATNPQRAPAPEQSIAEPVQGEADPVREPPAVPAPTEPMSLEVARNYYIQKDYDKAHTAYEQLREALPVNEKLLRDFLQLRMAVCSAEVGDLEQASRLLVGISRSPSPVVRILANFRLSLLEIRRKRYLRARTRAYNALALVKTVDFDDDWALALECDCYFLIAECLTRHVLSLSHGESDLPEDLWASHKASLDPFAGLSEVQLRGRLDCGSEHLGRGLLGPRIRKLTSSNRWSVTSYGAPVEELLAKFAAGAELDLHWAFEGIPARDPKDDLRQRPLSLYLPAASSQQVALAAAGCVGLLAHQENDAGRAKLVIHDPSAYTSLREHISFLSEQAISLWQKFVLTFYSDQRLGNAHFVMGLLHTQTGRAAEAIAEYKLVANRFSQAQLAPYALLHSSKVKASLRDYNGAREDLKQLVEQYDDCDIYGQAYLRLADATRDAELCADAAQLYQRVYNFGLSTESKTTSALGAAECFFETKAYEDAAKWLTRYIDIAEADENNNLYSAHFMLGQTNLALGNYQQACDAFKYALLEQNSRQQYIEAITALVKGHIEQEHFVEALDALENVRSVSLSQEQSVEMLLLRSKILRLLGLADTAVVSLRDRAQYVSDSQLSAKIAFELAQCDISKGNLEQARRRLSEILSIVEPGLLARQTALELIDVCLKLGRSSQAVSLCSQLLNSNLPDDMKHKALRFLAAGYSMQKDYDKAALALSGRWK